MLKGAPEVRRDFNLLHRHRDSEHMAPVWRDAALPCPCGNNSTYYFVHLKVKGAEVPLEPEQML